MSEQANKKFSKGAFHKKANNPRKYDAKNESNNAFIPFKLLKEIKDKEDYEIIMFFQKYPDISQTIKNTKFSKEMIYIMIDLLTRISFISSSSIILNQIIENTYFIEKEVKSLLNNIDIKDSNYLNFVLNLINLSNKLLDKFSKMNKRLKPGDFLELEDSLNFLIKENKGENNENNLLIQSILEKIKLFKERERHMNRLKLKESLGKKDIPISDKIPIDYKEADILISKKDLSTKNYKKIFPHIKVGSYYSYERYFNTNFYLEKEDCYRNLRKAINFLQSQEKSINDMNYEETKNIIKRFSDLYFYKNGEINYIEINSNGFIITLDFQGINSKKIKFTKRMISGSLVVLTDNKFSDYLLATVYYNPYFDLRNNEKENQENKTAKIIIPEYPYYRVQLSLVTINKQSFNFLIKNLKGLQIFESKAYFESYIHIMKRLQQIDINDLPFKSELIDADFSNIKMPQPETGYKYNNSIINPEKNEYPEEIKNFLDESQFNALKMTLSNKISLIRGPPGTGKTHFGALITNILLQNLNNKNDNIIYHDNNPSQILVVCYTNHALDQFIEKVTKFTNDIIRIGGKCQNEIVKQYELRNKNIKYSKNYDDLVKKLNKIGNNMKYIISLIDKRKGIIAPIVKDKFNDLYKKVINDFLFLVKKSIPPYYKKRLIINDEIEKSIYIFWNMIGIKDYSLTNIINVLFSKIDKQKEKDEDNYWFEEERDYLLTKIINAFKGLDEDNKNILEIINEGNLEINNNNNGNNIENLENEEEDDNDEDEYLENEEKLKYRENMQNNEENIEQEEDLDQQEILFNKNNIDFKEFSSLNQEKYEDLINPDNNYNFFKLGPKIIKLFNIFMKQELLKEEIKKGYDFSEYNDLFEKKNERALKDEAEAIKNYKIVAMTTTGCAKYSTILEKRNFEVTIIEEAAEVLESHVISLLTKNTKRLILIGDHKQLKPKPYNYEISTKYNFNVSLFERLINNKIPYSILKYQRRMKPIFADFIRIIYGGEDYIDFEDVANKEKIKGMKNDIFFIKHNKKETENIGLKSKQNEYEANYITALCNYLILQNYKEEQITILTFYLGQVFLIRKYLKKYNINKVKVTSVDNYQGEENDIILLSLVRSNFNSEIGFLNSFNRVCVAFSRAKLGFYIIGDIDFIVKSENDLYKKLKSKKIDLDKKMIGIWAKIKHKAEEIKIIGQELSLICQNHNKTTIITKIEDFSNCPEGGCQIPCKKRMHCGHTCEKLCHNYDCNSIKCTKPCQKYFLLCNHQCQKLCFQDCDKCEKLVQKKLPCGHIKNNCKCYLKENEIKCEEKCEKKLKCNHPCELKCYQECDEHLCKIKIKKKLLCGHEVMDECGKYICDIICKEKCGKILECGHECNGTCGECLNNSLHTKCQSKCNKVLPCGHLCEQKCSAECICDKICENECPHGYCQEYCLEPCVPCVEKCVIKCEHGKCFKTCGELCDRKPCNFRCEKKMKCGHRCYGLCGEKCPNVCRMCNPNAECFINDWFYKSELDEEDLLYETQCGHIYSVKCLDYYFESWNKVQMIICDQCRKNLKWEPRYQNYIRKMFDDIQSLKKIYIKRNYFSSDNESFYDKSKKIVNGILEQFGEQEEKDEKNNKKKYDKISPRIKIFDLYNNNNYFNKIQYENDNLEKKLNITYNLCKKFSAKENKYAKKVTTYNLLTLVEKFMGIEYYAYIIKLKKIQEEELLFLYNFNIIKNHFVFDGQFTHYFFKNLQKKINNMLYYSILKLSNFNKNEFLEKTRKNNFLLDFDLKNLICGLVDEKIYNVIKSLGNTVYRCPNGHLYSIGECGRPMEESKCPDCGALIGGRNHESAEQNISVNLDDIRRGNNDENYVLNQDEEAYQNTQNNFHQHQMAPEVEEAIRNNPEMNDYYH